MDVPQKGPLIAGNPAPPGVQKYKGPEAPIEVTIGGRSGAYVRFKQLDLTGVSAIVFSAMVPTPQLNALGGKVEVRLDSAAGPLVGETAAIQPAETMGARTQLRAVLAPTTGVHDVYFVFRNAEAMQGRNLFILTTATFEHAAPGARRTLPDNSRRGALGPT